MLCHWKTVALLVLLVSFGSEGSTRIFGKTQQDCLEEYKYCIKIAENTLKTKKKLMIGRANCGVIYYSCMAQIE
ncbi:hypothetical protein ScPMuIL_015361 [Solemya velum]